MTEKATLFVPRTNGSEQVLEEVCRRFSNEYGGATVRRGHEGYWTDSNGELIQDTVDVVFTFTDELDPDYLESTATYVKNELREDAVLTSVESAETQFV